MKVPHIGEFFYMADNNLVQVCKVDRSCIRVTKFSVINKGALSFEADTIPLFSDEGDHLKEGDVIDRNLNVINLKEVL